MMAVTMATMRRGWRSNSLQGLRSPLTRPGRFATKEKIVHALDNWILDRVLDKIGEAT